MMERLIDLSLRGVVALVWLVIAVVYTVLALPLLLLEGAARFGRRIY